MELSSAISCCIQRWPAGTLSLSLSLVSLSGLSLSLSGLTLSLSLSGLSLSDLSLSLVSISVWSPSVWSLSLCVCVHVFFFCKTSVKIGCFSLAPLASVNSVYLALWCVFRCLIKLLVLNKLLSFPPLDTVAVQILHCALLLSSSFILK